MNKFQLYYMIIHITKNYFDNKRERESDRENI